MGGKGGEGCVWCVGVNEGCEVCGGKAAGTGGVRERGREGVIWVSASLITLCLIER